MDGRVEKVKARARELYAGARASHDFGHALRVLENARQICEAEGIVFSVSIQTACLLHDAVHEGKAASESAKLAEKVCRESGFGGQEATKAARAVLEHSRSSGPGKQTCIESRVVYDADKVDGAGREGVERAILVGKENGWSEQQTAEWYIARLADVAKNAPLHFDFSRKLVRNRIKETEEFCRQVLGDKRFEEVITAHGLKELGMG
ncbi:HD domain-containing protein [Candidatus Micrarchaeota archaeon]|nr:HD domain-containing protein [Candidatus Micrarchaeota archaeon]